LSEPTLKNRPVETSGERRGGRRALGSFLIVCSSLWLALCGFMALLASGFGIDAAGWAILSAAVVAGSLVLVVGVSVLRGRWPSRLGWLGIAVVLLVVVAALGDTVSEQ
jgi:uncharacterized RDD family membrane protein YckC